MLLWTLADDSGRLRGSSRMLASLLYPYDDDAGKRIDGWLSELSRELCIVRYQADGDHYLQVCNWLKHQKIDRPSSSKIPPCDESSRVIDESSRDLVMGSKDLRTKDQGPRKRRETTDGADAPDVVRLISGLNPVAWSKWLEYRKVIGKPIKPISQEAAARQLAAYGTEQGAVVDQSIGNGWQGLFDLGRKAKLAVTAPNPDNPHAHLEMR